MTIYGQVVVGPPGSGKTTYCNGMQQYLRLVGRSDTLVINMDPANESTTTTNGSSAQKNGSDDHDEDSDSRGALSQHRGSARDATNDDDEGSDTDNQIKLPYDTLLDVCEEVVNLSSVMDELGLGPNGGLMYCMEYIEHHLDHLLSIIRSRLSARTYLLIDLPGQVELYTHCTCVQNILNRLTKELDLRLCMINLVDAHYCADASKFISAALLSTTTMLRLELPAVNVLSKIDMISKYGDLPYNLDFFTECNDLERLVPYLDGASAEEDDVDGGEKYGGDANEDDDWYDDPEYVSARTKTRSSNFFRRRQRMHELLSEVVDDYGLLRYLPLDISDAASVGRVVAQVDRANGYVFVGGRDGQGAGSNDDGGSGESEYEVSDMFRCAIKSEDAGWGYEQLADVQEKFMETFKDSIPELERSIT